MRTTAKTPRGPEKESKLQQKFQDDVQRLIGRLTPSGVAGAVRGYRGSISPLDHAPFPAHRADPVLPADFDPCFSCYDFQAAMTHEIGHVLGLGHPDVASTGGMNLEVNRTAGQLLALEITGKVAQTYGQGLRPGHLLESLSAAEVQELEACGGLESCFLQAEVDCWDPWPHTTVKPSKSETEADYAPTIMAAFTFNNPSSCIFQDDLDAINVLYPACSGTQTFPICTQPTTYVGYIRLVLCVGVPLVICLAANDPVQQVRHRHAAEGAGSQPRSDGELRQVPESAVQGRSARLDSGRRRSSCCASSGRGCWMRASNSTHRGWRRTARRSRTECSKSITQILPLLRRRRTRAATKILRSSGASGRRGQRRESLAARRIPRGEGALPRRSVENQL